ncbi:aldose 1-epimerase [Phenylobacterium sp.]|uniref:aldose 1-epimerase n=1 Tax=Phenylobacterium sp. TaxID=1871053 RepID=UPI002EDB0E45
MTPLELRHGDLRLALAPALGGSVLSFRLGDLDLLRPTPAGASDVLETACFPLVPYANRIADGRFTWGGRTAALAANMTGQAHPLHGDGWRGAWRVEGVDERSAVLELMPQGSAWPWRYSAAQSVRLSDRGLTLTLSVTNLDDAPGPFGLGFHPYFPDSATARLTAATTGVWEASDDLLPVREAAASPWCDSAPVRGNVLVDHCHTGWSGEARIELGLGKPPLRLTASRALRWLHVYAPPGEDFFCVEPVSHAPNALNMADPQAHGVWTLGPGDTGVAWMRLDLA